MISYDQLLLFFMISFFVSASPGPLMMLSLSSGVNEGYLKTVYGMLGASAAHLVLVCLTVAGINALMESWENLYSPIKWIGVTYLIYIGFKQLFARPARVIAEQGRIAQDRPIKIFLRFFIVSVSNPKALLFFAALLPQFVLFERPLFIQFFVLTLILVFTDLVWMSVYSVGGQAMANWLDVTGRQSWLNRISGAILIFAGALLAIP